jgi:secondary thiamine-phosphate synthase enzyme
MNSRNGSTAAAAAEAPATAASSSFKVFHNWRHNDPRYSDCDRRNADSHLRGMLMGQALSLQVRNSAVLLGTWQSIILAEFDGPRSRTMSVQVSGI